MSVAVGDAAVAAGPYSLAIKEPLTLPPDLTLAQLQKILVDLVFIAGLHSAMGHEEHHRALHTAIRRLAFLGDELFAIARHEAQRQAQPASKTEDVPPLPTETPTADGR